MPVAERGREDPALGELLALAREARDRAYAPYSGFQVGAALEAGDGRRYRGCNVENSSYPVGICAERAALSAAVSDGAVRFRRLALVADSSEPVSPCGMCRQALAEFGLDLEVVSVGSGGERKVWRLAELLPSSFSLQGRAEVSR